MTLLGYHLARDYSVHVERYAPIHENTGGFNCAITQTNTGDFHGWASIGDVNVQTQRSHATPEEAAHDLEQGFILISEMVERRCNTKP